MSGPSQGSKANVYEKIRGKETLLLTRFVYTPLLPTKILSRINLNESSWLTMAFEMVAAVYEWISLQKEGSYYYTQQCGPFEKRPV